MEREVKVKESWEPFDPKLDFVYKPGWILSVRSFARFCELSDWLSSHKRELKLLREASSTNSEEQMDAAVQVFIADVQIDLLF